MGLTKTQHFSSQQNRTAAIARALGHPARIAILEYLARRQICVCGDLVGELPLA
jgi:DNA-binding transcriptional ArsR family regulator